jgi:ribosomal protein L40E
MAKKCKPDETLPLFLYLRKHQRESNFVPGLMVEVEAEDTIVCPRCQFEGKAPRDGQEIRCGKCGLYMLRYKKELIISEE